jgi:hypothetical protein
VTFTVGSAGAWSDDTTYSTAALKLYAYTGSDGTRRYLPTYTAIIALNQGVPQSISFDEGCVFCGSLSPQCVSSGVAVDAAHPVPSYETNCYMSESECTPTPGLNGTAADSNSCDLTLYVVWTGSDADGTMTTSSSRRFSRFLSFSAQLPQLWSSVTNLGSNLVTRLGPQNQYAG